MNNNHLITESNTESDYCRNRGIVNRNVLRVKVDIKNQKE